uniref:Uncharacterized protein n=1 Tax=Peronospora matthiolae TaxID=2874970 RepID=A0AAV1UF59_9STRA
MLQQLYPVLDGLVTLAFRREDDSGFRKHHVEANFDVSYGSRARPIPAITFASTASTDRCVEVERGTNREFKPGKFPYRWKCLELTSRDGVAHHRTLTGVCLGKTSLRVEREAQIATLCVECGGSVSAVAVPRK